MSQSDRAHLREKAERQRRSRRLLDEKEAEIARLSLRVKELEDGERQRLIALLEEIEAYGSDWPLPKLVESPPPTLLAVRAKLAELRKEASE